MNSLLATMTAAFIASMWFERKVRRRREHAILDTHQRLMDLILAEQMESEGYTVVEVHVNERGQRLRDNAEWN